MQKVRKRKSKKDLKPKPTIAQLGYIGFQRWATLFGKYGDPCLRGGRLFDAIRGLAR